MLLSPLNRKLLRDLAHMKTQALAIALVMACGVATIVMGLSTLGSLSSARDAYYDRYRFAHAFTTLKRAPRALTARIAEIPGVARVQTRVVADVTLTVEGIPEPATGRLISIPAGDDPGLNALHLRAGRWPEPGRRAEVLANEAFTEAHGFRPGAHVSAVINGRRERLTIVGVALSPEYIYQIRPGELIPDNKRFGIFWMPEDELAPAFDMDGAFNDVALTLAHGASEPDVLRRLDLLIEPYGGLGAYARSDQTSHQYITDEMTQLRAMGTVPPAIFLGVAAFLVNIVLSRLIGAQREQIATLKAFGYTGREVGAHYAGLVLLIVAAGVTLGIALGARLGRGLTALYAEFFRFPAFDFTLDPRVALLALAVSAGAAALGAAAAVRRAIALPPAQAMRPEPPPSFRPTLVERLGLQRLFTHPARMILRQLERRPIRAALTSLGIAMGVAVLVLGNFTADAIDFLVDVEFNTVQRQDAIVTFVEPVSAAAIHEVRRLPGVLRAEPFRAVPARFRAGHRSHRTAITGLTPDAALRRPIDTAARAVPLPPDGVLLSTTLAEILRVRPGDWVRVEVLEGERPVRHARVAGLIDEFLGASAYMDLRALNRLMREDASLSGAFLDADPAALPTLYATLKVTPQVAGVSIKEAAVASFYETIGENLDRIRFFNVMFGIIIAFGVVYNSARISLAERSHELASLRVLGFTRAEISAILLGEFALLTALAIPAGLALGYAFAAIGAAGLKTETHRIPLVVNTSTYAFAVTVIASAAAASGLVVRRHLDRLDLVAVLKTKA